MEDDEDIADIFETDDDTDYNNCEIVNETDSDYEHDVEDKYVPNELNQLIDDKTDSFVKRGRRHRGEKNLENIS